MVDPDMQGLVLDCGSSYMKCGFSGDDAPRAVFPTVIGRTKNPLFCIGMDSKECYVGDEAEAKRGRYILKYPIQYGMVTNWNDMDRIFHHTFYNELRVTPEEHPVFLSESPLNSKNDREKITSIMFETFNVPGLYISVSNVLSLFATGRVIGTVLNCSYEVTNVVSIFEGIHFPGATVRIMNNAGKAIGENLEKLIRERGYTCTGSAELKLIMRDIKEKLCYVCLDYESELKKANSLNHCEHEYETPDGSKIKIDKERFLSTEILFQPIKKETLSFQEAILNSIQKCDYDLKRDLYPNIVLSGGSTMFEGLPKRLVKEVKSLAPKTEKVEVCAPAERKYSTWIGGSILSSLSTFQDRWITKEEYDETGSIIVNRKCY